MHLRLHRLFLHAKGSFLWESSIRLKKMCLSRNFKKLLTVTNFLHRIVIWQIDLCHIKLSDKKLPLIASTESTISLTLLTNQPVWYGGYLPRQTRALGMYCRVWHICMNADVWKDKLSFERHPHVAANWHVKHTHNGSCRTRKRLVKSLTLQSFIHFWHRVS